jgi:hypothetical protein
VGGALEAKGTRARSGIDCQPVRRVTVVYRLEHKHCPQCGRSVRARAPGVLPKSLYGNQLLTHVAAYRQAPVKHADETGWRTGGQNGYAGLFATPALRLFRFRKTRRAEVVREVFGPDPLPGVLVVDRYSAYTVVRCLLQYCYAHLLRTVEDLEKDFPDNAEIRSFVAALAPLLASAIALRPSPIRDRQFYRQAAPIKAPILEVTHREARHPAIQRVQDIFRENPERLCHWADDRRVPADNNLAQRDLRPLVIARTISFGSQSDAGARTRETLMTVLHSLKKRRPDAATVFKAALDKLAESPHLDPHGLLFSPDSY